MVTHRRGRRLAGGQCVRRVAALALAGSLLPGCATSTVDAAPKQSAAPKVAVSQPSPTTSDATSAPAPVSSGPFRCPALGKVAAATGRPFQTVSVSNRHMCGYALKPPGAQAAVEGIAVQQPIAEIGVHHDLAWQRDTMTQMQGDAVKDAPQYGDGSFLIVFPDSCDLYTELAGQGTLAITYTNFAHQNVDPCRPVDGMWHLLVGH